MDIPKNETAEMELSDMFESNILDMIRNPNTDPGTALTGHSFIRRLYLGRAILTGLVETHNEIAEKDNDEIDLQFLRERVAMLASTAAQLFPRHLHGYKVSFNHETQSITLEQLGAPKECEEAPDMAAPEVLPPVDNDPYNGR